MFRPHIAYGVSKKDSFYFSKIWVTVIRLKASVEVKLNAFFVSREGDGGVGTQFKCSILFS